MLADSDVESGTFSIDLDGVPRYLIFRGSFPRRGGATLPVLDFTPALRAQAADVTASGGRYAIVTLPDNAPSDAKLEIRIGRAGLVGFEPEPRLPVLPSPRKIRIGFALRDKALAFSAKVSDWVVPIDTEGVEGRRQIQIRLVNDVQTIREVVLPLAVDRSAAREVISLIPPAAPSPVPRSHFAPPEYRAPPARKRSFSSPASPPSTERHPNRSIHSQCPRLYRGPHDLGGHTRLAGKERSDGIERRFRQRRRLGFV